MVRRNDINQNAVGLHVDFVTSVFIKVHLHILNIFTCINLLLLVPSNIMWYFTQFPLKKLVLFNDEWQINYNIICLKSSIQIVNLNTKKLPHSFFAFIKVNALKSIHQCQFLCFKELDTFLTKYTDTLNS